MDYQIGDAFAGPFQYNERFSETGRYDFISFIQLETPDGHALELIYGGSAPVPQPCLPAVNPNP